MDVCDLVWVVILLVVLVLHYTVVERRSQAGELFLSYARLAADE